MIVHEAELEPWANRVEEPKPSEIGTYCARASEQAAPLRTMLQQLELSSAAHSIVLQLPLPVPAPHDAAVVDAHRAALATLEASMARITAK